MNKIEKRRIVEALERCLQSPELYTAADEIPAALSRRIPETWQSLLKVTSSKEAQAALRKLWAAAEDTVEDTITLMGDVVEGFAILHFRNAPHLIYVFNVNDRLKPYAGGLPVASSALPAKIEAVWKDLPAEVRTLYSVHNGWENFCTNEGGFHPVEKLEFLSDWVNEEEIASLLEDEPLDLTRTLILGSDAGGRNFGFEIGSDGSTSGLFYGKEQLERDIDFWSDYQSWIADKLDPQ